MSKLSTAARIVLGLELFLGIGALFGGAMLIAGPDGDLLGMDLELLNGSPFSSFLIPGVLLFTVLGIAPMVGAALTLRRNLRASWLAAALGVATVCWISTEMVMLSGAGSLAWALYLVLGTALATLGATSMARQRRTVVA